MSGYLVFLVLTAAVLHASWNAMVKSGGSPIFSIAAYQLAGACVCFVLIWFVPLPEAESWPYILASVLIHNIYYFSLARAYQVGDLSVVYPLFRGLAPVLVAIGAGWFAGEHLNRFAMVGIGLVSGGIFALAFFGNAKGRPSGEALKWALITSVMIAAYTVVDGFGVRAVDNSLSYILWLFLFEVTPVGLYLLIRHRQAWFDYMIASPGKILIGGMTSSLAYGLVIYAMNLGAMALVSSLRETSVIFAALIGCFILKESFGRQRIIAACLVALGVVVIRYFATAS